MSDVEWEPDPELLDKFRKEQNLIDLGFTFEQIDRMQAGRRNFDWHEAERLLKEGLSHELISWRLEPME